MANTFTGLKLQGQIGKFGAKELSDIEGWCLLYQSFYRVEFLWGGGGGVGGRQVGSGDIKDLSVKSVHGR